MITVVRGLEEAGGEGLTDYASVSGEDQAIHLGEAAQAIDEACAIVGGAADDDDDEAPNWPGEEGADHAGWWPEEERVRRRLLGSTRTRLASRRGLE
jgi:hypothetical protein